MNKPVLLMASGGLDSTTVAYWLRERSASVYPIFFDYGQHCVETEWNTLLHVLPQDFTDKVIKISLRDVFSGSNSRLISEADLWNEAVKAEDLYIPYRTLLFFAAAAAKAQTIGVSDVYSGFINSNHAKELDCSTDFLNNLGALADNVGPVRFISPFRDLTKVEVAQIAKDLNVPIGKTFSCQIWSQVPCGACPNCVDRLSAIEQLML